MSSSADGSAPAPRTPPFHLLAKPTGSSCNLACAYCFFRDKGALYPGSRQRMSDDVLDTYLRQLFEAQPDGPVAVAWQGGEPTLMGLAFFEHAVELAERYRRPRQQAKHTLQTNATLIDDAWAAFLSRHGFLVGVSLDGPAEVHDAYRTGAGGSGTHHRVMAGIARLNEHGVAWNALAGVHRANQERGAETYRFLRDEAGARFIQFIPIVERPTRDGVPTGAHVTERAVTGDGLGRFMRDVFDQWLASDVGEVFVQTFDDTLAGYVGEPRLCVHAPVCGRSLAMEFNGDVYSCDHFVQPDALVGSISSTPLVGLANGERQQAFGRRKLESLPSVCASCPVRPLCNGGCPKDRFVPDPRGGPPRNHLCAGYRAFFTHADAPMRVMATLLREGRSPAEVMSPALAEEARPRPAETLAAAVAVAGRNAPCPCGSGRKTKRCHGLE